MVTIPGGSLSATVTIATVDDSEGEADGSVTVAIEPNVAYDIGSPASATVAIQDDDASYTLAIAGGGPVGEAAGNATFTVTLTSPSTEPHSEEITVQWATANGTALAGSDYTAGGGTLSFAAGERGSALTKQLTVVITDDMLDESSEHFTVGLSAASGAGARIGTATATATITDNDVPALSIADVTAGEDDGTIVFEVTLSLQSDLVITATYTASNGTAKAGSDFTAASGTVTFPADSRSAGITIDLIDDSVAESTETFTVRLTNPSSSATLGDALATGTIEDDDLSFTLDIAGGGTVGEGGSATFTVTLTPLPATATPGEEITVRWDTANGTANAGSDYTAGSGTLSFAAGANGSATRQLTVATTDDMRHRRAQQ